MFHPSFQVLVERADSVFFFLTSDHRAVVKANVMHVGGPGFDYWRQHKIGHRGCITELYEPREENE